MQTRSRRLFLAFLVLISNLLSGSANAQQPESVDKYITDRSREWTAAYLSGDTSVMEEILAADFLGTSSNGNRYTKQDAIKDAKDGPSYFLSNRLFKIEVKVYGSTAVAFGVDLMKLKSNPDVEEAAVWTDTWLLRNGKWQVVASHESKPSATAVQ